VNEPVFGSAAIPAFVIVARPDDVLDLGRDALGSQRRIAVEAAAVGMTAMVGTAVRVVRVR
jgi:hypothetical protein